MVNVKINGKKHSLDMEPTTPLLWVLRDHLGMRGTKFGCGIGQCGACTVHLNGKPIRSCSMPVAALEGQEITTIEGLAESGKAVQDAWVDLDVPQCGYCQSGQVMSAVALLKEHPKPTDDQINAAMNGNICRCGAYQRIRQAIHQAAGQEG